MGSGVCAAEFFSAEKSNEKLIIFGNDFKEQVLLEFGC